MGVVAMQERNASPIEPTEPVVGGGRVILVVEDRLRLSRAVSYICSYLSLPMERASADSDLSSLLEQRQPMAVICELDGGLQNGCHVMKTVAQYDPSLPVMLVTGSDPSLIAAADAVEEISALSNLVKLQDVPGIGDIVEFLCGVTDESESYLRQP